MAENGEKRGTYRTPFPVERVHHEPNEGLEPGQVHKASQSLLARIDVCPYSGALYLKYRTENVQNHRMAGGEMLHECLQKLTEMQLDEAEEGEVIPPEVAKDWAVAWMQERTDLALTADEQEGVRTAVWNWAVAHNGLRDIQPASVIGVEVMLEMELAGWTIRGKADLLEQTERTGIVTDYKSSLNLPTIEAYERSFQNQFYALLFFEGRVDGEGGRVGEGLEGILTRQVFPRHDPKNNDGYLVTRYAYLQPQQIHDFRQALEGHLLRLEAGIATGEWAAAIGPHCNTCPAPSECPIPQGRRPKVIETDADAQAVGEELPARELAIRRDKAALRARVDEHGRVPIGGGKAYDLVFGVKEEGDKDRIKAALAEHGLDPSDFYKESKSTTLRLVDIEQEDENE